MVGRGASAARGLKKLSNPLCLLIGSTGVLARASKKIKTIMIAAMTAMSGLGGLTKVRCKMG